ncbi:MAG: DUF5131 family protein [Candidatus Thorarchaeota archaeon]
MTSNRMFPFITHTANPIGGECPYGCPYCWALALQAEKQWDKYKGETRLFPKELKKRYSEGDFVFAVTMRDPCSKDVTDAMLLEIFQWMKQSPDAKFLLLTKNPHRFYQLYDRGHSFPENLYLGATIETNREKHLGSALRQKERLYWMIRLSIIEELKGRLFLSIEPVVDFDIVDFANQINQIRPWAVAIGMDNYGHKLSEPPKSKILELIRILKLEYISVFEKTIRSAWWE